MARTFSSGNNLVYPSNANGTAPVTTGPLTLACWGRFTATSIQNVVFTGNASDHYFGISVGYVTAGRVAAVTGLSGDATAETTTGITTNTWHHCCAVFASATSRIAYIDGGSSGSNATSKNPASLANFSIGSYRNTANAQFGPTAGELAEVAIWNVGLTANEVAALARGVPPFRVRPDALAGYWPIYGLSSPEPDFKPGIQSATRYPMTLVGTPPIYAGHAPIILARRFSGLIESSTTGVTALPGTGALTLTGYAPVVTDGNASARLIPDTVAASTNLTGTGTIASIQDDPDFPDGSWFTATSATAATDLRVTFTSPVGPPAGSQNFRAYLRKTTGTPTPTIDLQLYQGGSLRLDAAQRHGHHQHNRRGGARLVERLGAYRHDRRFRCRVPHRLHSRYISPNRWGAGGVHCCRHR